MIKAILELATIYRLAFMLVSISAVQIENQLRFRGAKFNALNWIGCLKICRSFAWLFKQISALWTRI